MNEKLIKVDIEFNEALRRIAHTPMTPSNKSNETKIIGPKCKETEKAKSPNNDIASKDKLIKQR